MDGGGSVYSQPGVPLFESGNASQPRTFALTPGGSAMWPTSPAAAHIHALSVSGAPWAVAAAQRLVLMRPVFRSFQIAAPEPRKGFIQFALQKDFLHSTYRTKYVENVMKYSKSTSTDPPVILKEPYTPAVQSISLSYKAHTDEVAISSTNSADFSTPDIQFFQIAYFGQMREHGYQRDQFSFLTDKRVSLLPAYDNEGELLIGFNDLNPGDSVSVLFEVAEGSANHELDHEDIAWSVLCDNYWKSLGSDGVVLDTTNQLLASGIIKFVIPAGATTQNTILPTDRIWLRAGEKRNGGLPIDCRGGQCGRGAIPGPGQ